MQKNLNNNEPISIYTESGNIYVNITGDIIDFNSQNILQSIANHLKQKPRKIYITGSKIGKWDSSLLVVIYETIRLAIAGNIPRDISTLPQNIQSLMSLAFAVDRKPNHGNDNKGGFFESIGRQTVTVFSKIINVFAFFGEIFMAFGRCFTFRSIMRRVDFLAALDDCGPRALGIVSLISFLVGLILAFVGAVQLQTFGAQIYVASLVTIGMCRIMGAIMVGIIMAGRTGSAYAATIGTMQVNEELDALETMGLSRTDFLVMPRLLALLLAMPILTMLADIMGMIGGAFVGVFLMNLPHTEYWKYAFNAFNLTNFLVGIFHGFCFGFIIAICGCYSGLTCGRNADSVGIATTQSVVYSVVWMIVVTGIITVICQELGI